LDGWAHLSWKEKLVMSVALEVKVRSGKEKLVVSVRRAIDRRAHFARETSVAKKIEKSSQPQKA
jgi:hypothetical protein